MKLKFLPLLALMTSALVFGQTYNNGPLSTGVTASDGTVAPAGYTWSEIQSGNNTLGFTGVITATNTFSLADDFTVPTGEKWTLTGADFFGYQTGSTAQPFDKCYVRIFDASPASAGNLIYGDLTTNTMTSSDDSKIYRIGTSAIGTTRRVWQIKNTINKQLNPGTYWISETAHATNGSPAFFPPVTIVGSMGPAGANAVQESNGAWAAAVDTGSLVPQEMAFILYYTVQNMGVSETRQYDSRMVAYPNPTADTFKISIPENTKVQIIELYDMSGKLVKSFKQSDSYDISNLAKGAYLIKVKDGDAIKATRIIKK